MPNTGGNAYFRQGDSKWVGAMVDDPGRIVRLHLDPTPAFNRFASDGPLYDLEGDPLGIVSDLSYRDRLFDLSDTLYDRRARESGDSELRESLGSRAADLGRRAGELGERLRARGRSAGGEEDGAPGRADGGGRRTLSADDLARLEALGYRNVEADAQEGSPRPDRQIEGRERPAEDRFGGAPRLPFRDPKWIEAEDSVWRYRRGLMLERAKRSGGDGPPSGSPPSRRRPNGVQELSGARTLYREWLEARPDLDAALRWRIRYIDERMGRESEPTKAPSTR